MSRVWRPKLWRVEVEWEDSTLLAATWQTLAEIRKKRKLVHCISVGFVLADDKKGVVLASSVHQGRAAGVTIIPRGQIKRRRRLR